MNYVRSAARVLDLLEYLAGQPSGASLTQAVAALGMPKSSTLMLLRTLLARGYATRDANDRYSLNDVFRAHGFGWGGHRHARLIALAEPVMERLCEAVSETVMIGVIDSDKVRVLAKVVARQVLSYDADITKPVLFYCSAMGRILTAFSSETERDAMLKASPRKKLTPATVTDMDRLRAIVADVRVEGVAFAEEEWVLGATGIAAPVFDADGAIVAALDVGCVTTRFHIKRRQIIAALKAAAQNLTDIVSVQARPHLGADTRDSKVTAKGGKHERTRRVA